jgi:hypothetical protein
MIEMHFDYDGRLDSMEGEMRAAIARKLTELTTMLHAKVVENLSGKILQKVSGQLAGSVQQTVDTGGEPMVGEVFIDPASPKAWALEKGGEKNYMILPSKGTMLKFYWDKMGQTVFLKEVNHPPSREFGYLRLAAEEMVDLVPAGFNEVLQQLFDGY